MNKKELIELTLPNKFDESLICAGDQFSSALGTCAGDSGAPLLTDFFDRKSGETLFKILGVLHGGVVQCDNSEYPAIYTRISTPRIYNWIKEKVLREFFIRLPYFLIQFPPLNSSCSKNSVN